MTMTAKAPTLRWGAVSRRAQFSLWPPFAAIAIWTALVNAPFFRLEESDDAFYTLVAHLWTQGVAPYAGAFDVKAPGFFAILAAAQLAFGPHLATLKCVAIFFSSVAGCSIYGIASRYSRPAAIACAVLYPALSAMCGDVAYEALDAFTLLAVLAALSDAPTLRRALLAGLAIGAACAIKQTAALDAMAVLAMLLGAADAPAQRWRTAGVFVAAAAAAPIAFAAYFLGAGHFEIFWQDVVWAALSRPSAGADSISFAGGFRSMLWGQLPLTPITLAALAALANARTLSRRFPIGPLGLWLGAVVVSILVQHAVSRYYVTPAIAPLLLIATLGLAFPGGKPRLPSLRGAQRRSHPEAASRGPWIASPSARNDEGTISSLDSAAPDESAAVGGTPAALALFAVLALGVAIELRGAPLLRNLTPVDQDALTGATAAILATNPAPDDKLYVVNAGPWLNLTTSLAPPSPYFHRFHMLCDFPGAGLPKLKADMEALPRYVVVNARAEPMRCEEPSHWAVVRAALDASYRLAATAAGPADSYQIYERR